MPFQGLGFAQVVSKPNPNSQNQLRDITLWVDSATGSDTNPGTQTLPLQTLSRALEIRRFWGRGYANFIIKLIGVGPYTLGSGKSGFGTYSSGTLVIQGDSAAETVHLTGSFTGPAVSGVYPTTAGLGADTQRGRFLRITSGANSGRELQICENTDTSVTFATNNNVSAVANGVTFSIISPGTTISSAQITFWDGEETRCVFHRILFTSSLTVRNSKVAFATCRHSSSIASFINSVVGFGSSLTTQLGTSLSAAFFESGITLAGNSFSITSSQVSGRLVTATSNANTVDFGGLLTIAGGRFTTSLIATNGGQIFFAGAGGTQTSFFVWDAGVQAQDYGLIRLGNSGNPFGLQKFQVTSTNTACVRALRSGVVLERLSATNSPSGGATHATSYGHDASNGGRIYIYSGTPALTGGAGDLHITGTTVANATLNLADTAVGAAASLFGDVLARVGT